METPAMRNIRFLPPPASSIVHHFVESCDVVLRSLLLLMMTYLHTPELKIQKN